MHWHMSTGTHHFNIPFLEWKWCKIDILFHGIWGIWTNDVSDGNFTNTHAYLGKWDLWIWQMWNLTKTHLNNAATLNTQMCSNNTIYAKCRWAMQAHLEHKVAWYEWQLVAYWPPVCGIFYTCMFRHSVLLWSWKSSHSHQHLIHPTVCLYE